MVYKLYILPSKIIKIFYNIYIVLLIILLIILKRKIYMKKTRNTFYNKKSPNSKYNILEEAILLALKTLDKGDIKVLLMDKNENQ